MFQGNSNRLLKKTEVTVIVKVIDNQIIVLVIVIYNLNVEAIVIVSN